MDRVAPSRRHILRAMGQGGPSSWLGRSTSARDQCLADLRIADRGGNQDRGEAEGTGGTLHQDGCSRSVGTLKIVDDSVIEAIAALGSRSRRPTTIACSNRSRSAACGQLDPEGTEVEPILRGDEKGGHPSPWSTGTTPSRSFLAIVRTMLSSRDPNAQAILREIFASRTVLLVGFGGGLERPQFWSADEVGCRGVRQLDIPPFSALPGRGPLGASGSESSHPVHWTTG